MTFLNKPWREMTDDELVLSHDYWSERVRTAPGWSSAYQAAKYLKHCCAEAAKRNLPLTNPLPNRERIIK